MKVCPTCGVEKEIDQFHKSRSTKDGLNWQCKSCHKTRMRAQVERIAQSEKVIPNEKHCTGCGETKPSAAFSRNRVMLDGLSNWCRDCDQRKSHALVERNKARSFISAPETKLCGRCGEEKPSSEFCVSRTRLMGVDSTCRKCRGLLDAGLKVKYRRKNSEKDPHSVIQSKQCHDCMKVLPSTQFGKVLTRADGLSHRCKPCALAHSKRYARDSRERVMWLAAKSRAKKQGVPFDIEIEDIVIPDKRPVLGVEWGSDRKSNLPSLDKIIPAKGYVKGNIAVMSMRANRLKNDATPDELRRLADFYGSL